MIIGSLYKTRWNNILLFDFRTDEDSIVRDFVGYIEKDSIFVLLAVNDVREGYLKLLMLDGRIGWIDCVNYFSSSCEEITK